MARGWEHGQPPPPHCSPGSGLDEGGMSYPGVGFDGRGGNTFRGGKCNVELFSKWYSVGGNGAKGKVRVRGLWWTQARDSIREPTGSGQVGSGWADLLRLRE